METTKSFLVRCKQPQRDKVNETVNTWEEALKHLGKEEKDIDFKVPWLNHIDHFFKGTEDYIRETTLD